MKQTYQKRKRHGRLAAHAKAEFHWVLLGLGAIALYTRVELDRNAAEGNRLSLASALRAIRRAMRDYARPASSSDNPGVWLRQAIIEEYQRDSRTSRDDPQIQQRSPIGPPHNRLASRTEAE